MRICASLSGSELSFVSSGLLPGELGIPYALDPRNTSVITSVGRGDPMGLGLWKVMQGDDRGDDWNLSVMNCDAEVELGGPRTDHSRTGKTEQEFGGPRTD